jgi:uncharacterized protein YcnI
MNPEHTPPQPKIITSADIPRSEPRVEVPVSSKVNYSEPNPARFKQGQEVIVRRSSKNGAPSLLEAGWTVDSVDAENGVVVTLSPDGLYEKTIAIASLEALNPIETELRLKAQQDLGEEAIDAFEEDLANSASSAAGRLLSLEKKEAPQDTYEYLRTALPPVVRPEHMHYQEEYDKWLQGDTSDQPEVQQFSHSPSETEEDRQRKYYDTFVTQENRESAVVTLSEAMKATPEIREVLALNRLDPSSLDAVDALRENPEVRFEVAKILAKKLDRLVSDPYNDLGWRITKNSPNNLKADPQTGARMSSRLYAVSMALKMIDGEFSNRHEGNDPINRDEQGRVSVGQHRHAASSILMTYI